MTGYIFPDAESFRRMMDAEAERFSYSWVPQWNLDRRPDEASLGMPYWSFHWGNLRICNGYDMRFRWQVSFMLGNVDIYDCYPPIFNTFLKVGQTERGWFRMSHVLKGPVNSMTGHRHCTLCGDSWPSYRGCLFFWQWLLRKFRITRAP